jgi:UDP:flavonoid glycosyltransferase YjiC (YdhE family)
MQTPNGRYLFALWDGGGTAPPELAVASRLIRRAHRVTVIGDPTLEEDVRATGARFVPWRRAPHRTTRTEPGEIVRDWAALTPLGAFARARDRHAFKPAHLFAREVRELFTAEPADVLVVDAMLFGALVGAESTGARVAALLPMTSFLPAPGRPPPAMGFAPARGLLGRARDRVVLSVGDAVLWRSCLRYLNDARREVGLEAVEHPLDQLRRADRVLVQTSAWFDFRATARHDNVRYVGPELVDPTWAAPARAVEPQVLVAFSTTFMGQVRIVQKVIDAIASLRLPALVTTGPSFGGRALHAPPHVTVVESASHAEVLPTAKLVVTHGGHGTVIRALAFGVPVLCLPMGRDQGDNAARAVAVSAGVTLSAHASTSRIARAIARAVDDPTLHDGARRALEQIARERVGDPVIEELEGLLHA